MIGPIAAVTSVASAAIEPLKESNGNKRLLGTLFFIVSSVFYNIPNLIPYAWIPMTLGTAFGLGGHAHAKIVQRRKQRRDDAASELEDSLED